MVFNMPLALFTIGMMLIITGFQNTYQAMGKQIQSDFTGPGNFFYWLIAITVVGSVGYIKGLQGFSNAFLSLIVMAIFLNKNNKDFFSKFTSSLSGGSTTPVNPIGAPLPAASSGGSGSTSGGGSSITSDIGTAVQVASIAASFA